MWQWLKKLSGWFSAAPVWRPHSRQIVKEYRFIKGESVGIDLSRTPAWVALVATMMVKTETGMQKVVSRVAEVGPDGNGNLITQEALQKLAVQMVGQLVRVKLPSAPDDRGLIVGIVSHAEVKRSSKEEG